MTGKIESGQLCTVEPLADREPVVGDIVLCRIKGSQYLHLVKAIQGERFQIGNNRGGISGWITRRQIYGRLSAPSVCRIGGRDRWHSEKIWLVARFLHVNRANSSRTITAPYGRAAARRQPVAREIAALEVASPASPVSIAPLDDDPGAIAGSAPCDAPTVARTRTGEWPRTSESWEAAGSEETAASDECGDVAWREGREMPRLHDDLAYDIELDESELALEPTAPAIPACQIELVEEIPTGHETSQALEVTTISVESSPGAGDSLELPAFAPLAFGAPAPASTDAKAGAVAVTEDEVAAILDFVAARVALRASSTSCACSPEDGPQALADLAARRGLATREGRDEIDVEEALLAWRRGLLHPRSAATTIRAADRGLDDLIVDRSTLRSLVLELAAPRDPEDPVRVVIRGRRGSGRHTTVAALAARIDRRIACIDARRLPLGPGRAVALRRELARAVSAGAIPVISGIEVRDDDDPATALRIAQILRAHPGPLVVRTGEGTRVPLEPGHIDVVLAPLSEADRRRAFSAALERHAVPASAELLASRHCIGPGTIADAVSEARRRLDHCDDDATAIVDAVVRQQVAARVAGTAVRVTRLATWDEVLLPDATLDSVHELIARARHRRTVLEDWGYDRFATGRGLTALFHGPSGTGKTMIAGLIARELGALLYRVDLDRLLVKQAGDPEGQIDELFDAAADGGFLLLFDEAEPLLAARAARSAERNPAADYLLQRLDAFDGIAILTTSVDDSLDPAFKRRLSVRVRFALPDERLRAQLWAAHVTPELPIAGALDFARLARQFPLSGGAIRNSALRAAFLAAQEHSPVTQSHLERAIAFEVRELDASDDRRRLDRPG